MIPEPAAAHAAEGSVVLKQQGTVAMREMGREVGIGIGMVLLATILATASVRSTFPQTEMVTVNIPPQELSSALTALAEQANLQVLYASELVIWDMPSCSFCSKEGRLKKLNWSKL